VSAKGTHPNGDGARMGPVYAGVIVVEAIVLMAIWLFQRYFGS
jgi:hypothetical protein